MTLKQLLGYTAEELAAKSDVEIEEFFKPYITHIRPEFKPAKKENVGIPSSKVTSNQSNMELRFANLMKKAEEKGILPAQ